MMRTLIIGAGGFAGNYLIAELKKNDVDLEIFVTKLSFEKMNDELVVDVTVIDLDITDAGAVSSLFREIRPDFVYHLAAQSSAKISWEKPQLTMEVNVIGAINILEAIREHCPKTRLLLIGSGEEYGKVMPNEIPIKEDTLVRPANIYAVSKLTQNLLGKLYVEAYGLNIVFVRAFNHIGPGQNETFVASDFCKQVAKIEKGLQNPVIKVGNLSATRDFTDVRDIAKCYRLLMKMGKNGETYNVGGGTICQIGILLEKILLLSKCEITVEVDKDKLRPIDTPKISADITKLQKDTGFKPTIPMEDTLMMLLEYWRKFL